MAGKKANTHTAARQFTIVASCNFAGCVVKIGVFDSGVGGMSVVRAINKSLPELEVVFANDTKNVPYGTKTPDALYDLVLPILQDLVSQNCRVIVIACNTVSTTLIDKLRDKITIPLIAMEPMIKPAVQLSKSGVIAVCATPATLASKRYAQLKEKYAEHTKVLEPDCSDWSTMIESNNIDRARIADIIERSCNERADVIVLGCTHYHWIEDIINDEAKGRAVVIQPEKPVIEQLKRVLKQLP